MRVYLLRGQALWFSRQSPEQPSTARAQGQTAAHTDRSDRALQLGDNYLAEVLLSGRGGLVLTALLEPLAPQTRPHLSTAVALRCSHHVSVDFDFFSARPLEQGLFYGSSRQTIGESLQALCALRGFLQEFFPVVRRMAAGQPQLENPVGIALAAVGALGVGVVDPAQDNQP